jgi:16S rRNA processing protein RimM
MRNRDDAQDSPELVAVAALGKPRGLDGACHLYPLGEALLRRGKGSYFWGTDERDTRPCVLERVAGTPEKPVGYFQNVSSREDAELLRGRTLFIPRSALPDLGDDEFYHFQLVGLQAQDRQGRLVGTVESVHNYPTVDAVEIRRAQGGTVVVPLDKHSVPRIDMQAGVIVVDTERLEELL